MTAEPAARLPVTWPNSGSDHGAVSGRGPSDASSVASSAPTITFAEETDLRSLTATRALRNSDAGTPVAAEARRDESASPTKGSPSRGLMDAVVSGPATMKRPSITNQGSMHPSGSTGPGSGGPSATHTDSTRSRSMVGGGNSR